MKNAWSVVAVLALTPLFVAAPVLAQVDLSGHWIDDGTQDWQDRSIGPYAVEYYGFPMNEEARARALSFSADLLDTADHQCMDYASNYLLAGPSTMTMWADIDQDTNSVIAWNISGTLDREPIKIWMDGRPEPGPQAPHTLSGFSTGTWQGDTLVVHITHLQESSLRRNGVPLSDQTTMTLYITRNDDLLTITGLIHDPIYLTETFAVQRVWKYSQRPLAGGPVACTPAVELPQTAHGAIPNFLPQKNPNVGYMTKLYHIPVDAVLGGAQTMYPEYERQLKKDGYTVPSTYCPIYCCDNRDVSCAVQLSER